MKNIPLVRMAEICSMTTGRLDSNAAEKDGEYPFFTCAQETFQINTYAFDTEAVLLGGNNANGIFPLKYYSGKFNAYQRTYVLETRNPNILLTRYLYYALMPALGYFRNASIGAATQYLTKPILDNFQIRLFSISTQQKMVSILSVYDDLIENNRHRIELLEQSARLLYREWFVSLRFPGHEHAKIKEGVPQGWERIPLGDILTLQRGFDLPTSQRIEGDIPIYASTGINGYHNKAMVSAPGVVTGRSGSLGTVMYVLDDFFPLNTSLWVKEFKRVSPVFAYHLLSGMHLEKYNGGVSVPTLNRNDVHRIEVLCPPQKIMDIFVDYVLSIYEQKKLLTLSNKKLQQARDLLLPRLMNGEIAV